MKIKEQKKHKCHRDGHILDEQSKIEFDKESALKYFDPNPVLTEKPTGINAWLLNPVNYYSTIKATCAHCRCIYEFKRSHDSDFIKARLFDPAGPKKIRDLENEINFLKNCNINSNAEIYRIKNKYWFLFWRWRSFTAPW